MRSVDNTFSTYELTAEEQVLSDQLSQLNVAKIQNLRSQIAEEKLNLVFTPNDTLTYTQSEAYLKGQLDLLTFLLQSHEEANQFHKIESSQS